MSKGHNTLTVGFSNGLFNMIDLPTFTTVHSLTITNEGKIATMDVNHSGDWIAFGCPSLGQLMVWEWQSETCMP
jgi:periodic tryptophan protein 2